MKKPEIKNPVKRWFAALGTIILAIVAGTTTIIGIVYGLGRLGEPLFWKFQPQLIRARFITEKVEVFNFKASLGWGSMVLVGLLIVAVCMILLYFLGKGIEWAGNRLYDNAGTKVVVTEAV